MRVIFYNKEYTKNTKGRQNEIINLENYMDEAQKDKVMAVCSCGSEKKFGNCCGASEMCFCGSDKAVSECCMKAPEEQPAA